jgi:hypothetical protein
MNLFSFDPDLSSALCDISGKKANQEYFKKGYSGTGIVFTI